MNVYALSLFALYAFRLLLERSVFVHLHHVCGADIGVRTVENQIGIGHAFSQFCFKFHHLDPLRTGTYPGHVTHDPALSGRTQHLGISGRVRAHGSIPYDLPVSGLGRSCIQGHSQSETRGKPEFLHVRLLYNATMWTSQTRHFLQASLLEE